MRDAFLKSIHGALVKPEYQLGFVYNLKEPMGS